MLSLLYKDCFIYIKSKAWISLIFYYIISIGTLLLNDNTIVLLIMMIFALGNSLTYLVWLDDKYNAPLFMSALNIHRHKLLLSRFIFVTLIIVLFTIAVCIPTLIFIDTYQPTVFILRILYYLCFISLQLGIDIFIINQLGFGSSKWVLYIINTIIGITACISFGVFSSSFLTNTYSPLWIGILLLLICTLIWYSSYSINAKIYEKMDF